MVDPVGVAAAELIVAFELAEEAAEVIALEPVTEEAADDAVLDGAPVKLADALEGLLAAVNSELASCAMTSGSRMTSFQTERRIAANRTGIQLDGSWLLLLKSASSIFGFPASSLTLANDITSQAS